MPPDTLHRKQPPHLRRLQIPCAAELRYDGELHKELFEEEDIVNDTQERHFACALRRGYQVRHSAWMHGHRDMLGAMQG